MYRRKLGIFAAAAMVTCALAGASFAQGMGHGPGFGGPPQMMGGPPPFMMLLKTANLTEAQRTQVRQILKSDRSTIKGEFGQLHSIHEQIADKLLSKGAVSASDLEPLVQQAAKIQQQIDMQRLQTALKIRALLTPDQLSKVAQTHQRLKGLFDQMRTIVGPPEGDDA
jgi:periplasmic protein CpxP/Spy